MTKTYNKRENPLFYNQNWLVKIQHNPFYLIKLPTTK